MGFFLQAYKILVSVSTDIYSCVFAPLVHFFLKKAAWGSLLFVLYGSHGGPTSGGWEDFIVVILRYCMYSPLGKLASFSQGSILRISRAILSQGAAALCAGSPWTHASASEKGHLYALHPAQDARNKLWSVSTMLLSHNLHWVSGAGALLLLSSVAFRYCVAITNTVCLVFSISVLSKDWLRLLLSKYWPSIRMCSKSQYSTLFFLAWLLLFCLQESL